MEGVRHIKLMANLILTTDCQRKCHYCFARDDRDKHMKFTWENFKIATDFIATIQPKMVNLLGGEPTLHEDFPRMLDYLLANDFMVQVFTNGMLSEERLDEIDEVLTHVTLRREQLWFAVNVNEEKDRAKGETEKQAALFDRFHKLAYPSFTIHEKDVDLTFLVDLVDKHFLDRTIRLGLAMPLPGGTNKYLPIEYYRNAAESIIHLSKNSPNISKVFDCGFVLCMFEMQEILSLSQDEHNDFMFLCGQPIDIYPDLKAANCYPLSKVYKADIRDYRSIVELYKFFEDGWMTPHGIYKEKCVDCEFFRKVCWGGCKGFYGLKSKGDDRWKELNGQTPGP